MEIRYLALPYNHEGPATGPIMHPRSTRIGKEENRYNFPRGTGPDAMDPFTCPSLRLAASVPVNKSGVGER